MTQELGHLEAMWSFSWPHKTGTWASKTSQSWFSYSMAGSGGLLEPSGLDADAAASDVAGMAPPGLAFAGLAQLPLAPTLGAHALAAVLLDLASAVALGMEMLDAAAAPAVGMVLLDITSASWFHST